MSGTPGEFAYCLRKARRWISWGYLCCLLSVASLVYCLGGFDAVGSLVGEHTLVIRGMAQYLPIVALFCSLLASHRDASRIHKIWSTGLFLLAVILLLSGAAID